MPNSTDRSGPQAASPLIALTGASGRLGRLILGSLMKSVPANRIIATTRRPERLAKEAAAGLTVRRADFDHPASLPEAFRGASRLLIVSTGDHEEIYSGRRRLQHRAAIAAAREAGVRHIAYTSCASATSEEADDPVLSDHGDAERELARSGLTWTALRNNIGMEGIPYFLKALRVGDKLLVPEGSSEPCWVASSDYASVAASVLAGSCDLEGAVEVTGPEALGLVELAKRWSKYQGRTMEAIVLPANEVIERLVENGAPRESARGIVANANGMFRFFAVPVSDAVRKATGAPPVRIDGLLRGLCLP